MELTINDFRGEYAFLSNFYWFELEGYGLTTVEHEFQARKTEDLLWASKIRGAESPATAKRLGRQAPMRPHWDELKDGVMLALVRMKFRTPELREKLLATGDAKLVEGNWWHDEYWGVDHRTGAGQNRLGKTLMGVRNYYREHALDTTALPGVE